VVGGGRLEVVEGADVAAHVLEASAAAVSTAANQLTGEGPR
jgi:hypothetical protein